MIRTRSWIFLVAAVFILLFLFTTWAGNFALPQQWQQAWSTETTASTSAANHHAAQSKTAWTELRLPETFEFRRLCFHTRQRKGVVRQSVQEIPEALLGYAPATSVDMADGDLPPCQSVTTMDVPEFDGHEYTDMSTLMLGVATTLKRIDESLPAFSRWLSNTGSPLLVLLVDQADLDAVNSKIEKVRTKAAEMGIALLFEPYIGHADDTEGLKNFALAEALNNNIEPRTKWFALVDDDTFFVSLPQAYEALEPYDHTLPWYIGALTEGHSRIKQEGWKAWGGAGFFVSPVLMKTIAENSSECRRLDQGFGDLLWRDCILEVTSPTIGLTEMKGLNQIDMWSDISGFYESGLNPLFTIHHWKSWHFHPIPNAHIVTDVAGPDTFLQRYKFADDFVLTNGFSAVHYPNGLPDLKLAELTMVEDVGITRTPSKLEFHHSMGGMRPALQVGKDKISWKFQYAIDTGDGTVRQFYVKAADRNAAGSVDNVIEIDWSQA